MNGGRSYKGKSAAAVEKFALDLAGCLGFGMRVDTHGLMWVAGGGLHQLGWCTKAAPGASRRYRNNTNTSTNTDTNTPENTYMWSVSGGLHQLGWCTKAAPGAPSRRHTNTNTSTNTDKNTHENTYVGGGLHLLGWCTRMHHMHYPEDIQIQVQIHTDTSKNTNADTNTHENTYIWLVGGGLHQLGWCTRMHQVHQCTICSCIPTDLQSYPSYATNDCCNR